MIRPNGRNCCRRWPMGRRPPGASESLWTVCSLGGQASGFGRNQAPKTDRLNQVPSWEFRNRRKSFTPRQLARILWDFAYLCWANLQLLDRWRQVTRGERFNVPTIEKYCLDWLESKKQVGKASANTLVRYEPVLGRFVE